MNTKDSVEDFVVYCPSTCYQEGEQLCGKICYFKEGNYCFWPCEDDSQCVTTYQEGVCCSLPCDVGIV